MTWIRTKIGAFEFIAWKELVQLGVVHGFGDASLSYNSEQKQTFKKSLGEILSVEEVYEATQVHGREVFDINSSELPPSADILVGTLNRLGNSAMFIKTADCVPLIGVGSSRAVLIHAGWRGLACGAVRRGLELIRDLSLVLIGPCAESCCYEVGEDVITALSTDGSFVQRDSKTFLSTSRTAIRQINKLYPSMPVHSTKICTICNSKYNSYRRVGNPERNITFIKTN